jgi:soluble lytic murein transglycosylase-like protein
MNKGFIFLFLLVIIGGIGNIVITSMLPEKYKLPYGDGYSEYSSIDDWQKLSYTKEEMEELLKYQKQIENKINELTISLQNFEGLEADRVLLEQYVNDLKTGKVNVTVDHIVNNVINNVIQKASATHGVPQHYIRGIIKVESNFNPNVVSHAGAQGLMQLMPSTARGMGVTNAFDIEQNIMGGTKYFKYCLNEFNNNYDLALAAYNAGDGAVRRAGNKIPNNKETRAYVPKVSYWASIYKNS